MYTTELTAACKLDDSVRSACEDVRTQAQYATLRGYHDAIEGIDPDGSSESYMAGYEAGTYGYEAPEIMDLMKHRADVADADQERCEFVDKVISEETFDDVSF